MFMVISDDLEWCRHELEPINKNVIINENYGTLFEDLALISLGQHTVVSLGTYGTWGALLGSGDIVFPANKISNQTYYLQRSYFHINDSRVKGIYW